MDLGATICTPRPRLRRLPLVRGLPGRRARIAAKLPRREDKPAKPLRHGTVWLALRADARARGDSSAPGLLGGMLGLPGDAWSETPPPPRPPFAADWRDLGEVRHTFTHFHLVLRLKGARLPAGTPAPFGEWPRSRPRSSARSLPFMRKALRLGLPAHAAMTARQAAAGNRAP